MTAPDPQSIRLARAAWDAATPGTRALFFMRTRYAGRKLIEFDRGDVPFLAWDELPAEIASEIAWDVQFVSRVLRGGQAALRASEGASGASMRVAA